MDPTSTEYAEAIPPPTEGIFGGIASLFNSGRRVVTGVFRLFALEARRAGLTLMWMVALGAMAAMLLVTAWLGLMGAAALWVVSLGLTWSGALVVIALANLAAAAVALLICMSISRNLLFPATRRQMEGQPKRPDAT